MNAWALARTLDPLPQRLALSLGPDDSGIVASLVGAVWSMDRCTDGHIGPWRECARELTHRLATGHALQHGVHTLTEQRRPGSGAAAAATYEAWQEARAALASVRAAVTWPQQPNADLWLKWLHGRNQRGRTHHYSQLLLALTGRPSCLWSADRLANRLFERPAAPHDLDTLVRVQLDREDLRTHDDPVSHDVRGLPMARYLAAWLLLETAPTTGSPHAWLERATQQLKAVTDRAWTDGLPLLRTVGAAGRWTARELTQRRRGEAGPDGAQPALSEAERVGTALAFALNQTADNFAVRVMPTLALWRDFWATIHPWMDAYPDVAPPGREEAWLWEWRLLDERGVPWSASRLFLKVSRAVQEARPADLTVRAFHPDHRVGCAALVELVDEVVRRLGTTSAAQRARYREDGLRWQPTPITHHPDPHRFGFE